MDPIIPIVLIVAVAVCLLILVILYAFKLHKGSKDATELKRGGSVRINDDIKFEGNEQIRLKKESEELLAEAEQTYQPEPMPQAAPETPVEPEPEPEPVLQQAQPEPEPEPEPVAEDLIVNQEDNLDEHIFNENEIVFHKEEAPVKEPEPEKPSPFEMEQQAEELYQTIVAEETKQAEQAIQEQEEPQEPEAQNDGAEQITIADLIAQHPLDEAAPTTQTNTANMPYVFGHAYLDELGDIHLNKFTVYQIKDDTDLNTNLYVATAKTPEIKMILFNTLFTIKSGETLALEEGDLLVPLEDMVLRYDDSEDDNEETPAEE